MSDIVEFLRARLDEDEAIAEANRTSFGPCGPHDVVSWEQHAYSGNVWWPDTNAMVATGQHGDLDDNVGKHIVQHDPARVLREVATKRELLAWSEAMAPSMGVSLQELLAAPYCDHPDYRREWTP